MLSQELIFSALEAERNGDLFTVDFERVWQDLGYSRKDSAKRTLVKCLVENEDFHINVDKAKSGISGTLIENIFLSVDGYKHFALMARTPQGRKARQYFIEIERQYRQQLERQLQAPVIPQVTQADFCHTAEEGYTKTIAELHEVSGLSSKWYVGTVVKEYFERNADWTLEDETKKYSIIMTNETYLILMLSFRSDRGVEVESLPEFVTINTARYYRFQQERRNRRLPAKRIKNQNAVPKGQLNLFDI